MSAALLARVRAAVGALADPELPWVTLAELGVLRAVDELDARVVVSLVPTYSGCPALTEMLRAAHAAAVAAGAVDPLVRLVLDPPWSSAQLSEAGRGKLAAAGIAPPTGAGRAAAGPVALALARRPPLTCPRCGSRRTTELSRFSATSCLALHRCADCAEPFDHFKDF